ncbi:MAG TPA: hypothetical protein VIO33_09280 [Burkholderiaceae bacterium]
MQVDALALHLRPRSMAEAADLGVRLVQANARSVWGTFTPLFAAVVLIALASVELAGWLPGLIIFWLKPWLDRSLLYVLSRAVFGTPTRWSDLWRDRSSVWWQQLPSSLIARRLSPWRSYTQPAAQLEGQRGSAAKARRRQMLRDKQGQALGMHLVFAHIELVLTLGAMSLAVWFLPGFDSGSHHTPWFETLLRDESVSLSLLSSAVYAGVVLLLEPFYVAAGFAMYLNRRVELEAWDIEQEFRLAFAA